MNPEEGDLRPQLLDRFGLCVEVAGLRDFTKRGEIVKRRLAFETDPESFLAQWKPEEERQARMLEQAKEMLPMVDVPDRLVELAGRLSLSMGAEGHRSDLTIIKAAKAMAALDGLERVTEKELVQAAEMALRHRVRQRGLTDAKFDKKKLQKALDELSEEEPQPTPQPIAEVKKKISLL